MRKLGLLTALVALSLGCSDSTGPADGGGNGAFAITVSAGTNPTYSWAGGTTAHSVSVMRVAAPTTIVWGVASVTQAIPSPVTHGTVPATGIVSANTEPTLTAGVAYRVSITLQDSKTAWKEFTP